VQFQNYNFRAESYLQEIGVMITLVYQLLAGVLIALFSSLLTFFITSKSNEKRIVEMESRLGKAIKEAVEAAIKTHKDAEHKVNMFNYIDESFKEHKAECGKGLSSAIFNLEARLSKMEIRQVKINMKTNLQLSFVEKIASKMNIPIDISSMIKEGDEDE
jgi:hypothetical protein